MASFFSAAAASSRTSTRTFQSSPKMSNPMTIHGNPWNNNGNGFNRQNIPPSERGPVIVRRRLRAVDKNLLKCPVCYEIILNPKMEQKPTERAWITGFIMAILGCFCGCCLIPCFIDRESILLCPRCNSVVG